MEELIKKINALAKKSKEEGENMADTKYNNGRPKKKRNSRQN